MMRDEVIDAVVIEADGVEHAAGGLDGARRRIAGARLPRYRLGNDPAELGEIDHARHLARVAERAARDEDGILQAEAAEGDGEINHRCLRSSVADESPETRQADEGPLKIQRMM